MAQIQALFYFYSTLIVRGNIPAEIHFIHLLTACVHLERAPPLTASCSCSIELETESWKTEVSWFYRRLAVSAFGASLERQTLMVSGTGTGRTDTESFKCMQNGIFRNIKLSTHDIRAEEEVSNCQGGWQAAACFNAPPPQDRFANSQSSDSQAELSAWRPAYTVPGNPQLCLFPEPICV